MRLNVFVAQATGMSRRQADTAIKNGHIQVNGVVAQLGTQLIDTDQVAYNSQPLRLQPMQLLLLHKPVGYVCSRDGQGSKTIYDLLPEKYHALKPVGRLDKDSSGLLLLTNDGQLANELTHPSSKKVKVYEVTLTTPLASSDQRKLTHNGVMISDGISRFDELRRLNKNNDMHWTIVMHEGRNRQIRRTFIQLGYRVIKLHRTQFGDYKLESLKSAQTRSISFPD